MIKKSVCVFLLSFQKESDTIFLSSCCYTTFINFCLFTIFILTTLIPLLSAIAFFVVAERKILAAVQRRVGPTTVGIWGLLQAVADGFKLINKEIIWPSKSNKYLYFTAPVLSLFLSWIGWLYIPFTWQSVYFDDPYSTLVILSISSLNVYGVIVAGWSSNSKYAFLGALRASAQMISYEIIISIIIIPVFFLSSSLNLTDIVNSQTSGWYLVSLFPVAVIFLIAIIAETNRAPFDLPEAEGELVAGFNIEYGSIIFSFFFLAEYGNILLMSAFYCLLFWGGWLHPFDIFNTEIFLDIIFFVLKIILISVFFILIRSIVPRYRYDQLMFLCWKCFLPSVFSYIVVFIFWHIYININSKLTHCELSIIYKFLYSDYVLFTPIIAEKGFINFFKRWIWDFGVHHILSEKDSFRKRILKLLIWGHLFPGSIAYALHIADVNPAWIGVTCVFYAVRLVYVLEQEFRKMYEKVPHLIYKISYWALRIFWISILLSVIHGSFF